MTARTKRSIFFAVGLAVGIGAVDWFSSNEISLIKLITGGIVGGLVYNLMLKWQGRDK